MKTLLICLLLIGVSSCGKSTKSGSNDKEHTSELSTDTTPEEKDLIKALLAAKSLSEKDVLKRLLLLKNIDETVLSNLDKEIEINCINGNCELKGKN